MPFKADSQHVKSAGKRKTLPANAAATNYKIVAKNVINLFIRLF